LHPAGSARLRDNHDEAPSQVVEVAEQREERLARARVDPAGDGQGAGPALGGCVVAHVEDRAAGASARPRTVTKIPRFRPRPGII